MNLIVYIFTGLISQGRNEKISEMIVLWNFMAQEKYIEQLQSTLLALSYCISSSKQ